MNDERKNMNLARKSITKAPKGIMQTFFSRIKSKHENIKNT